MGKPIRVQVSLPAPIMYGDFLGIVAKFPSAVRRGGRNADGVVVIINSGNPTQDLLIRVAHK